MRFYRPINSLEEVSLAMPPIQPWLLGGYFHAYGEIVSYQALGPWFDHWSPILAHQTLPRHCNRYTNGPRVSDQYVPGHVPAGAPTKFLQFLQVGLLLVS